MLEQLEYLKTIGKTFKDDSVAPIWQLINRLKELETYADCITGIQQAFRECNVKSVGLRKMEEYVSSVCESSGFEYLRSDIQNLLTETSRIRSITLGVNLDEMLCLVEVGILSINEDKFDHSGILDNFLGFCAKMTELINLNTGSMTKIHKVCIAPPEGVSYARDIAEKYGVTLDQLKKTMNGAVCKKRAS